VEKKDEVRKGGGRGKKGRRKRRKERKGRRRGRKRKEEKWKSCMLQRPASLACSYEGPPEDQSSHLRGPTF
jgi:hypothetical protein